jgi:hypothetical protein
VDVSYFRDRDGAEVDATVKHARHLALVRDKLGERFTTGLVTHAGPQTLPLGDRLWAVPVGASWRSER